MKQTNKKMSENLATQNTEIPKTQQHIDGKTRESTINLILNFLFFFLELFFMICGVYLMYNLYNSCRWVENNFAYISSKTKSLENRLQSIEDFNYEEDQDQEEQDQDKKNDKDQDVEKENPSRENEKEAVDVLLEMSSSVSEFGPEPSKVVVENEEPKGKKKRGPKRKT